MSAPGEAHYRRVDRQAFEVVKLVLPFLEERGFDYVLAGGWAVYAYGTRVPSADTDAYMREAQAVEARSLVERELGVTTGPGGRFETLALDGFNRILGPDPELGEPDRGYVPADLLRGHVRRVTLTVDDVALTASVPEPRELAFTKLKALHDRELAYRALRDAAVMARIPPSDRGEIREKTESYYFAKAAKDLFDAAFLSAHHAHLEDVLDVCRTHGLASDLEPPLRAPDPDVRREALGLARIDNATREWLEKETR